MAGEQLGGTFDPAQNATITGTWNFSNVPTLTTGGSLVSTSSTQTLTNKTLTAPVIKSNVISGSGATVTLTAAQSGSIVLFDRAAGIVFTLPAPSVGLFYEFIVTTTITSNAATVTTDAPTTYMVGAVMQAVADTTPAADPGPKLFAADGTSTVTISSNGTTTGGIKGQWIRVTCISTTCWQVSGIVYASGVIATPFA